MLDTPKFPVEPQFGTTTDAAVVAYCPGPSARLRCQSSERAASGQLDILKFDQDSLVATFAFETEKGRIMTEGLIKRRVKR